jgi:hypothetical protein
MFGKDQNQQEILVTHARETIIEEPIQETTAIIGIGILIDEIGRTIVVQVEIEIIETAAENEVETEMMVGGGTGVIVMTIYEKVEAQAQWLSEISSEE